MKNVISTLRIHIAYIVLLSYCPLHAEYISDAEMDSLAMKFYSWEKGNENDALLRQQISDFNIARELESYTQNHEYTIAQDNSLQTYIDKILIIVKSNIYSAMPSYIVRYAHDIHNAYGCAVDIVSVSGETAPQIRSLIQSYSTNLDGAVIIGDVISAYFYHPDSIVGTVKVWEEETFPCDLFYMDINGTWGLKNGETCIYDKHTGNVKPEIFVGRINTATMGRNEVQELKFYFDRNHRYWTGKKMLNKQKALTFTGPDWNTINFRTSVSPLYGSNYFDAVFGSAFNKNNYCTYIQNSNYEFIQLACHSKAQLHNFKTTTDSILYYYSIYSLNTKSIGYNLFCCKACNWTSYNNNPCIGESYLYGQNGNASTLAVIGSTKTGSMLGFSDFYTPLGNGKCIGQSHKLWWIDNCGSNHSLYTIHWFYGMTILGDPLIDFNYTNDCKDILTINCGAETTNRRYYAQSKIIVQNYSISSGKSVTLSAPTIQINAPFLCNSGAQFVARVDDWCVCNTNKSSKMTEKRLKKGSHNVVLNNSLQLTCYPNPASDFLTIESNHELVRIVFYNSNGQIVLQTTDTQIDISHLSKGIYIIRAVTEDGRILQTKIIHK